MAPETSSIVNTVVSLRHCPSAICPVSQISMVPESRFNGPRVTCQWMQNSLAPKNHRLYVQRLFQASAAASAASSAAPSAASSAASSAAVAAFFAHGASRPPPSILKSTISCVIMTMHDIWAKMRSLPLGLMCAGTREDRPLLRFESVSKFNKAEAQNVATFCEALTDARTRWRLRFPLEGISRTSKTKWLLVFLDLTTNMFILCKHL